MDLQWSHEGLLKTQQQSGVKSLNGLCTGFFLNLQVETNCGEKILAVLLSCLSKIKFDATTLLNCFGKVYEAICDWNKEHCKKISIYKTKGRLHSLKKTQYILRSNALAVSCRLGKNLIVNLLERLKLQTLGNVWKEQRGKVNEFGHLHKQAAYPQATKSFFLCFLWTTEYLITVQEVEWLQWKESLQPQKSSPGNA